MTADHKIHDDYRIKYLHEQIYPMEQAVSLDGISLMGYTMWSAIDLVFNVTGEMKKHYPKDSFNWYKKVIASNGEDLN